MSRVSVKAYRHLASILADAGQKNPPPEPGSHWQGGMPDAFPAQWASSWGEDEFGLWCGFSLDDVEQRMRWIPGGTASIGSPDTEAERYDDEVRYSVNIDGFWMAETACTQQLWEIVLKDNPSKFKHELNPVEQVSWEDIQNQFLPALQQRIPPLTVRLPTEVEWEYACRAGTESPFWWGDVLTSELANFNGESPYASGKKTEYRKKTLPVFEFHPNPWGLYQMHGNVWEWCSDRWANDPREKPGSETGDTGRARVVRGGSWNGRGRSLRSACRVSDVPDDRGSDLGFRLVAGSQSGPDK